MNRILYQSRDEQLSVVSCIQVDCVSMAANGLEDEVRQRLLAAENVEEDRAQPEDQQQYGTFFPPPPPLLHTAPIPATHAIYTRDPTELTKTASRPKRYRLVLLITLGFDLGLVVFLSIISFVVS